VASAGSDSGDVSEEAHGPRECMACRGSGKVISNLGGSPKTVTCPWCEGGGVRIPGIDAQTHSTGGSDAGDSPPVE
jgi:DnaJ-class molecular chaperone